MSTRNARARAPSGVRRCAPPRGQRMNLARGGVVSGERGGGGGAGWREGEGEGCLGGGNGGGGLGGGPGAGGERRLAVALGHEVRSAGDGFSRP